MDAIRRNNMVFGVGPAGTGKTYLACAMAVNALKNKEIERIILARPAVEAGESWDSFRETFRRRWIRTFARCTMPSMKSWDRKQRPE